MSGLRVENLQISYSSGGYVVRPIEDLSFTAERGELVILLGASGCGKTSVLSALAGILKPTSGHIWIDNADVCSMNAESIVTHRRHNVGVVFQSFNLIGSLTALENVEIPMLLAGVSRTDARGRAVKLLERVSLADRSSHRPAQLSGGQKQRVAFARALANDPKLLLADEPTAHLDYVQIEGVVQTLRDLVSEDRTVVIATHDERLLPLATRVVELTPHRAGQSGREVTLTAKDVLFRQGDESDLVYLLQSGRLEIVRELADGTEERVATVNPGRYVGELGPLLGLRRSATVRALQRSVLVGMPAHEFRAGVGRSTLTSSEPALD